MVAKPEDSVIYINKQTSLMFNCVTPVSVSLATLARQQTTTFIHLV